MLTLRQALAVALTLGAALPVAVLAQDDYEDKPKSTTMSGSAAAASERARLKREAAKAKTEAKVAAMFPGATRAEPGLKGTPQGGKVLREMLAAYEAKQYAQVFDLSGKLTAAAYANAYDRAFAYQLAANAAADSGDKAAASDYFRKALDANGLDNNSHYQVMYNLAVMQHGLGKHAESLKTLNTFLVETKSDKPEYSGLKAALLGASGDKTQAAALYAQQLAKNPTDKKTLMNAVALYQQAGQQDKANALLVDAQKRGLLTEAPEYRAIYVGYINAGKLKDAAMLIDEGRKQGVLEPSNELATDLMAIGQNAYVQGDVALATDMFKQAASMSSSGEASLNLAKVHFNAGRYADAKVAAQAALAKGGLKNPEDAKKLIAPQPRAKAK